MTGNSSGYTIDDDGSHTGKKHTVLYVTRAMYYLVPIMLLVGVTLHLGLIFR